MANRNNWFVIHKGKIHVVHGGYNGNSTLCNTIDFWDKNPVRVEKAFMKGSTICKSCTDIMQRKIRKPSLYKNDPQHIEAAILAASFLRSLTERK